MLRRAKCLLCAMILAATLHGLHSLAPFGPPYPITASWFQDRFSKAEWNNTLTDFQAIGGDTVLLRAPAIRLRTEQDLEQDPEFQVRVMSFRNTAGNVVRGNQKVMQIESSRELPNMIFGIRQNVNRQWCGDMDERGIRTRNCTDSARHDLAAYNITVTQFATFQYEENYNESQIMQCPQYDKRMVTSRIYFRLVLPLAETLLSTPCNLNNTSVFVVFTTFAGLDPHELLLETAYDKNISVYFGLPRPVTVYDKGVPEMNTKFLPPYKEFVKRTLLDHKFRYSHQYSSIPPKILYTLVKGYYVEDGLTLADVHIKEIFIINTFYKPVVDMLRNVSKELAVGSSVQMNRIEKNSTIDENVKGFEVLAKAGVKVISVAEGRGLGYGGYFWETQATKPIATVDMELIESLTYKYPSISPNATFDDVFWISVQKMFEALGQSRDGLVKAGTNVGLWLTVQAFQHQRSVTDLCLPVDRAGSGISQLLDRVSKSQIDWALTAASWNVQKVAGFAWDPCFTCRTEQHASPLAYQIKQDMNRPIIAKCFFHSSFNRSVVIIGYNLEGETQGFTVNWPDIHGTRHISNAYGYYFELDWGTEHQRIPSLEYTQLYDPYDIVQLNDHGWVKVSIGGGYHSCSFEFDFRDSNYL